MARIIGIDYGIKNCGIAVTDELQIIVNPLKTVKTSRLYSFIEEYCNIENVEKIVFGLPTHHDGNPTYLQEHIFNFVDQLKKLEQNLEIDFQNENYSSSQAQEIIMQCGLSKKQRRDKSRLDRISAVIILQRYLKHI